MLLLSCKTPTLFVVLRGGLSEDDSEEESAEEEEEEASGQKTGQKEEESPDLQLNLDIDEQFKLPTDEQIEREDILSIRGTHAPAAAWGLDTAEELRLDSVMSIA